MIKLDNDWYIDVKSDCYVLQEKYVLKNEKEGFRNQTYHSNLFQCFRKYKKYVDEIYFKDKVIDLKESLDYLVESESKFIELIDKFEKSK